MGRIHHRRAVLGGALAAAVLGLGPAGAQVAGPQTETLYVDSLQGRGAEAARLLRAYVAATRAESGLASALLLHEIGRPDRFAVYAVWRDDAALNAHLAAIGRKGLEAALAPSLKAPVDERIGSLLTPRGERAPVARLHVLVHIDVAPPGADRITEALKGQAEAARAAPGFWGFELSGQDGRTNHFTLYQAWRDARAFADHSAGPDARRVRAQIAEVKGALYDERLYRAD